MKRCLYIILICIHLFLNFSCKGKRGPLLPTFNLQMIDSTTIMSSSEIPAGHPFVLVYFSPDCSHCQEVTSEILSKMESLKQLKFYFITIDPFDRLRVFNDYYKIKLYPIIVLGRDYSFAFVNELRPSGTPCIFIYDSKKRLKAFYNGGATVSEIVSSTKNS
jgi:hypothetical protein